jgi:3-dehydroquinate synthase
MAPRVGRLLLRSIDIMLDELRGNLFEDELARAMDLGHTFSQPLELGSGGAALHHGHAVAVDVNLSMRLAAGRGYVTEGDVAAVLALSRDLGMTMTVLGLGAEAFWASLSERALHRGGRQRVPLPGPVGRCRFVDDLTRDEIARAVATFVRDVAAQPQGVQ